MTEKNNYIDKRLQYGVCLNHGTKSDFWLKMIPSNANFDFCLILEIEACCLYVGTVYKTPNKSHPLNWHNLNWILVSPMILIESQWFTDKNSRTGFQTEKSLKEWVFIDIMEVKRIQIF